MAIIAEALQGSANEMGVTIVHRGMPSNSNAVALFKRTKGYGQVEIKGDTFWEKVFQPQPG